MAPSRPNVVMYVSDRQHWDSLGAVGTPNVHTPHLDWVANQGVTFRRAYSTCPICSPARASIISGLYPHAHGMVANHQVRPGAELMRYPTGVTNVAQYLGGLGYACGYAGKWHIGSGSARPGFDDFASRSKDFDVDSPEDDDNEILHFTRKVGFNLTGKLGGDDPDPARFDKASKYGPQLLPLAYHTAFRHMDKTVNWVHDMANDERPMFLIYSSKEPHEPFGSPEPFFSQYRPPDMQIPETRKDPAGPALRAQRRDVQIKRTMTGLSDEQLQRVYAGFFSAVTYVDHLVGRLIAALVDTGRWDNTLFIFTSDHGDMLGHHGAFGQFAMQYEDVTRIPFIVRPPGGLDSARSTEQLISHVDLTPTIVSWCGGTVDPSVQGSDASALFRGDDAVIHDGVVNEYYSANWTELPCPMRAWITDDWKYVATQDGTDQLFDLANDPNELHNLVADPAHAADLTRAKQGFQKWCDATGDSWPQVVQPPFLTVDLDDRGSVIAKEAVQ